MGKGPVVYWMSRDQRAKDNWALLFSQNLAFRTNKPLVVLFCLAKSYLNAQKKHFLFMLEGLKEVEADLSEKNIPFILAEGKPWEAVIHFSKMHQISSLVTDFSPLKIKRGWVEKIMKSSRVPVYEVDAHNIVPCWQASDKQEYAAYTFRPKIDRLKNRFLKDFDSLKKQDIPEGFKLFGNKWEKIYKERGLGRGLLKKLVQKPGQKQAFVVMEDFLARKLDDYAKNRNDPSKDCTSNLSAYLHFGQVSSQRIALETLKIEPDKNTDAFLEELIVRKELSDNFCYYNRDYDRFEGFPGWAKKTLLAHIDDKRPYIYSLKRLECGDTHDDIWNAAQIEMIKTGKMHGYMRMYWAKKLLEWAKNPFEALKSAIYLNDRYLLDGRDPNGYTGIAWSIGAVHDRAWKDREIFGKVRYMSYKGLSKKFDTGSYIEKIKKLDLLK